MFELPHYIDLALIGSGPHSLTLIAHLLQKKKSMRRRFLVFDPSGGWMTRWNQQFAALEIPHLRSPAVHQPDPNPHALRTFAESRRDELFAPYDLPGTRLFQDFCEDVVQKWQLADCIYPAQVRAIKILERRQGRFCLELSDNRCIIARRVVLASGGAFPQVPEWASQISRNYPPDRLLHSQQVDLRDLQLYGEMVAIVGGGLTSGHLAIGAIARGAKVLLISRRCLYEKLFDADPGWLGPKYLKAFWAEPDWNQRLHLVLTARNGGSMTPAILTQLRRHQREGKLIFYDNCQVEGVKWREEGWEIYSDCPDLNERSPHRIWLATGSKLDVGEYPLLKEVLEAHPIETAGGLPVLDDRLRWRGCELFIMGGLAALQVGPTARNLSGARAASERIVPALFKSTLDLPVTG